MSKKTKNIVLFLIFYSFTFWLGFKSGEIHNRMKNEIKIERVPLFYDRTSPMNEILNVRTKGDEHGFYNDVIREDFDKRFYEKAESDVKCSNDKGVFK